MSNSNQINTPADTADALRLPYKQEVGGSSPSAPTIPSFKINSISSMDPLPRKGSGSNDGAHPKQNSQNVTFGGQACG